MEGQGSQTKQRSLECDGLSLEGHRIMTKSVGVKASGARVRMHILLLPQFTRENSGFG